MVTLLQRADGFPRAKDANVQALHEAKEAGRLDFITEATLNRIEQGASGESLYVAVVDTPRRRSASSLRSGDRPSRRSAAAQIR